MPVSKLDCSIEAAVQQVTGQHKELAIKDIQPDSDFTKVYVQGKIHTKWPLQKTKTQCHLKLVLEDGCGSNINVFFFGGIAEEMDCCKKNENLILTDFEVQSSPQMGTSRHPFQLLLEDKGGKSPNVWIVEQRKTSDSASPVVETSSDPVPGTSSGKEGTLKKKKYSYSPLNSLKVNTIVDVFGVVKFFKPPKKSRGTDYTILISLVDPSLCENDEKLKCVFFFRDQSKIPPVQVGHVVRFHRLKIGSHNGDLQGQNGAGFSWLIFDGSEAGLMNPKSSSPNFTFSEDDRKRVQELQSWSNNLEQLKEPDRVCILADIVPAGYFDLVCQVVSTCMIEEGVCYLLRVWDGTRPIYPVRELDTGREDSDVITDENLLKRATGFICDVCIFDDHFTTGRNIKPRNFIKLSNLHAAVYKNQETQDDCAALPMVELVLHRGTSYGRGITFLNDQSQDVVKLKQKLEEIFSEQNVNSDSGAAVENQSKKNCEEASSPEAKRRRISSERQQTEELTESLECPGSDLQLSDDLQKSLSSADTSIESWTQGSSDHRCMLETVTVIQNHHHIKRTRIQNVLQHDVPFKFRIQARVVDFYPKPLTATDFIKLFCPSCNFLSSVSAFSNKKVKKDRNVDKDGKSPDNSTEKTGLLSFMESSVDEDDQSPQKPICPCCSADDDNEAELQFTFMVRFLLHDGTGWLVANLWRNNAVKFFKDIQPEEAVKDSSVFEEVKGFAAQLCPPGVELSKKPWLECCICSYTGESGVCYQIFDTTVA